MESAAKKPKPNELTVYGCQLALFFFNAEPSTKRSSARPNASTNLPAGPVAPSGAQWRPVAPSGA
eukprot:3291993-Heterocapsa_arctica.AAC.1